MRALKCDRCGKFYEHYDGINIWSDKVNGLRFIYRYNDYDFSNHTTFDLCPECMNALKLFLKNKGADLTEERCRE